jgi:ABC-2 type transport system permease protein
VNPFADSLSGGTTVALANPVGLEDMLFRYGIRINYNLLSDMQCSPVPVNTATTGEQPRFTLMPWVYHPLFSGNADHPVTRGLNYVRGEFASSMDTVGSDPRLKRTVLLSSSEASRLRDVPLYISMEEITLQPDRALYRGGPHPVAILSEGIFPSFFRNYPVPAGVHPAAADVLPESKATALLVVTDGGLPGNPVKLDRGVYRAEPLGYDPYTRQTFGNQDFLLNVINQMTDESGIMELRAREFKLRLLNRELTTRRSHVLKWKVLNGLLPILLVILAGAAMHVIRKRKYSH